MHSAWGVIIPKDKLEEDFDISLVKPGTEVADYQEQVESTLQEIMQPYQEGYGTLENVWDWYRIGGRWAGLLAGANSDLAEWLDKKNKDPDWHYGSSPEQISLGNMARVSDVPEDLFKKLHGIITPLGVTFDNPYDQPFWDPGAEGLGLYKVDEQGEIVREKVKDYWGSGMDADIAVDSDEYTAYKREIECEMQRQLVQFRGEYIVIVDCHI